MPRSTLQPGDPPVAGNNATHEGPGEASPGGGRDLDRVKSIEPIDTPPAPASANGLPGPDAQRTEVDRTHSRRRRTLRSLRRRRNSKNL